MRLPPHPNIVPFERLVLDELHGNIVGFTTRHIPGGTIQDNSSRTFKLEWVRQLTGVIDKLNFNHGILHGDVAARNLLVDPKTDAIMLFDFNCSDRVGRDGWQKFPDDVTGVVYTLYEVITRDTDFRDCYSMPLERAVVQDMDEWVQHPDVRLDHPVSEYRSVLNEWVERRRHGRQLAGFYTEAPEYIDWPDLVEPVQYRDLTDGLGRTSRFCRRLPMSVLRRDVRQRGVRPLNWERPAQSKLGDGQRVFANGQLVGTCDSGGPRSSWCGALDLLWQFWNTFGAMSYLVRKVNWAIC